ncbi:unnamed protein product, partial [marine sediment metagenome]
MTDGENNKYSDKEIEKILKRASDLQREEMRRAGGVGEVSLNELESIGKEVGIDPELIRTAALEVETETRAKLATRFLGEAPRYARSFSIHRQLSLKDC